MLEFKTVLNSEIPDSHAGTARFLSVVEFFYYSSLTRPHISYPVPGSGMGQCRRAKSARGFYPFFFDTFSPLSLSLEQATDSLSVELGIRIPVVSGNPYSLS